jgi:hypothetical protein
MISSHDDFRLLLNKWMSESREVFVIILQRVGSDPRCLAVVIGELIDVDENTLSVKGEDGNCAMVHFSDCGFNYEFQLHEWTVLAPFLTGRTFEDVFILMSPTGMVFAVGDATSRS